MFTLLAIGPWLPSQVLLEYFPSTRPHIPEVEAAISAAWTEGLARTPKLFDGPMCRLESFSAAPASLTLRLSPTSYKVFYGTNLYRPHLRATHGSEAFANPVGLSAALVTSDDYLLFGRRTANVAYYPNRTHPFAGSLEPTDATPFAGIHRELAEELSLTPAELHSPRLLGIVSDDTLQQPELIIQIHTHKTLADLSSSLDPAEHHQLYSIPTTPDAIASASHDPAFTPVALATLQLFATVST